jgi:hypothetical protein
MYDVLVHASIASASRAPSRVVDDGKGTMT